MATVAADLGILAAADTFDQTTDFHHERLADLPYVAILSIDSVGPSFWADEKVLK